MQFFFISIDWLLEIISAISIILVNVYCVRADSIKINFSNEFFYLELSDYPVFIIPLTNLSSLFIRFGICSKVVKTSWRFLKCVLFVVIRLKMDTFLFILVFNPKSVSFRVIIDTLSLKTTKIGAFKFKNFI